MNKERRILKHFIIRRSLFSRLLGMRFKVYLSLEQKMARAYGTSEWRVFSRTGINPGVIPTHRDLTALKRMQNNYR